MKHKNLAILIGGVSKEPIFKNIGTDDAMAIFSVCTSLPFVDASGKEKEEIEFHQCVCFGRQANLMERLELTKGSNVFVEGKLRTNRYTNQEGESRETKQLVVEDWIKLSY